MKNKKRKKTEVETECLLDVIVIKRFRMLLKELLYVDILWEPNLLNFSFGTWECCRRSPNFKKLNIFLYLREND